MADLDELLFELPRGNRGALRVRRCTERGSPPFIDVRHFYPDEQSGELKPARGVRLKLSEVSAVAAGLMAFARTLTVDDAKPTAAAAKPPSPRPAAAPRTSTGRQQRELPIAGAGPRQPQDDGVGAVSDEDRRLAEELF